MNVEGWKSKRPPSNAPALDRFEPIARRLCLLVFSELGALGVSAVHRLELKARRASGAAAFRNGAIHHCNWCTPKHERALGPAAYLKWLEVATSTSLASP